MKGYTCSMTTTENTAKAPITAEWMKTYDQRQADDAAVLLARLPQRRIRTRKAAK
jgi:hypothetical protein